MFHQLHLNISIILVTIMFSVGQAMAQTSDCTYRIQSENIRVKWEAFKTPAKVGVEGMLKKSTIKGDGSGKSIAEILKKVTLIIDSGSVFTKDAARDKKIVDNFFSALAGNKTIEAQVVEMKEESLTVNITMNGVTQKVPMNFSENNGNFQATGWIDILDFNGATQLKAINQACLEKHEGKTWNDVAVEINALFKKKCQ
jgi:polyisoprenoid-binding protein YceI